MAVMIDPKMVPPTAAPMTAPWFSEAEQLFCSSCSGHIKLASDTVVIVIIADVVVDAVVVDSVVVDAVIVCGGVALALVVVIGR